MRDHSTVREKSGQTHSHGGDKETHAGSDLVRPLSVVGRSSAWNVDIEAVRLHGRNRMILALRSRREDSFSQ